MPGLGGSEQEFEELWQQQRSRDRAAREATEALRRDANAAIEAFKKELAQQGGLDASKIAQLGELLKREEKIKERKLGEFAQMMIEAQKDEEELVPMIEAPALVMIGNNQRAIRAVGVAEGKPFIALITGRGGQYKWERKWVGQRTSRSRTLASGEIELLAGFGSLGTLPAALDIRWGPRAPGGLCLCRGFFRALNASPYFEPISEQQVAFIINQRVAELPDRPVNTPGRRAPINFDEEV